MSATSRSSTPTPATPIRVRILATTDLHGHVLAYDYIKDRPTQGTGLAGITTLIRQARREAAAQGAACLLLDNGDTFQGTALAHHLAHQRVGPDHPIAAAFNLLRYDAVGVGNHDLDHGPCYLRAVAGTLDMPMLCSNLTGDGMDPLRPDALIEIPSPNPMDRPIRIGLLSLLPAHTAAWHAHHLRAGRIDANPQAKIVEQARALRARGADLVVLLAHMGVGREERDGRKELSALALARTGAIDALILGHVHLRLPSAAYDGRPDVDAENGTIAGVPAVMPGHAGSDLAVLDLSLTRDSNDRWRVSQHTATLRQHLPDVPEDPQIVALAAPAHNRLRTILSEPVATTRAHLHSYFSLAAPTHTQRILARTLHRVVTEGLSADDRGGLPVIAAVAAQGAGGRDGPSNFTSIPPGQILRRHVVGLTPYDNQTLGIEITGAEITHWLEHAAAVFTQLEPDAPFQPLVDQDIPAFQFDTIYGLSYQIDTTAAAYDRLRDLRHQGVSVAPDQRFILATNQFRVAGGGGYAPVAAARVRMRQTEGLEQAIIQTLKTAAPDPWDKEEPWQFAPAGGRQAILLTDPDARACLSDIAHLHPIPLARDAAGFLPLRLTL